MLAFKTGGAGGNEGASTLVQYADVAALAKTDGAQAGHGLLALHGVPFIDVVTGADQPVIRWKGADVGEFVGHRFRVVRRIPAIADETLAARQAGGLDQAAHDGLAGVVLIVQLDRAFKLRGRRQQDELALGVVDEVVAAILEKTRLAQRLDDASFDLVSRTALCSFAGVDRFGNLDADINVFGQVFFEQCFGTGAGKLDVAECAVDFGIQAGANLFVRLTFQTVQRGFVAAQMLPGKKAGQCHRQQQGEKQCADQVDAGNGFLVGGQVQHCVKYGKLMLSITFG